MSLANISHGPLGRLRDVLVQLAVLFGMHCMCHKNRPISLCLYRSQASIHIVARVIVFIRHLDGRDCVVDVVGLCASITNLPYIYRYC